MKRLLLSAAVIALTGFSPSGEALAQQRTYGSPYQGTDGRTYMMDNYHCFYVAHQGRWYNAGCHTALQAQAHNAQLLAQAQRLVQAQAAQAQNQNGGMRLRPDGRNTGYWNNICGGYGGCVMDIIHPQPNIGVGGITSGCPWCEGNQYRYEYRR